MAIIKPFPECDWFSIDEDQYLMYLLRGYEIKHIDIWRIVEFRLDGKYHREDGPAIIWEDGIAEYWLNGGYYPKEEYYEKLSNIC